MHGLISHFPKSIRVLLKSPGFTITAVAILALGIGANTAIFSLLNGVLLKPLPYPNAERLVQLYQPSPKSERDSFDFPDFLDYAASQHSFEALSAYFPDDFTLAGRGEPERIHGLWTTGEFFRILGRSFILGRPFGVAEYQSGTPNVAVISEHLWRSLFHADPSVVGANLVLNGISYQVIGVTPGQADESSRVDLYIPWSQSPDFGTWLRTSRASHNFWCLGRLKEGVTIEQAQADLEVIRQNLAVRYPATNKAFDIRVIPYLDSVMGNYTMTLWLLSGAVVCLLAITCGNVANLLLVRGQERRREIAIRAALGAGRLRLIGEGLLESAVLAALGGILGGLLSIWALGAIRKLMPADVPRFQDIRLDSGALAFVLVATALTALLCGLIPSVANSKTNLACAIRQEGDRSGTAARERHRARSLLVAAQVTLTCVLLIGAGLLARTFQALQDASLGFNPRNSLTASVYLSDTKKYATQGDCQVFFDALVAKLERLPGVKAAGLNCNLPFSPLLPGMGLRFAIAGQPDPDPTQTPLLEGQWVTPNYFKAIELPLLQGRLLSDQDSPDKENVVVINESIAKRFFPGQNPIGKQIHDFKDRDTNGLKRHFYTIVGVVGNVEHNSPDLPQRSFQAYFPYWQNVNQPTPISWGSLVIHGSGDYRSFINPLRMTVATIDPNLALYDIEGFDDLIAQSFATKRLAAVVVSLFSGAALLLAVVGLYGILSYSVAQRKRELGIRIALGAPSRRILRLIVGRGFRVVGIGVLAGLAVALPLSYLIASFLYGVSAVDLVSIGMSVLVLSSSALIACLLPALRAARTDPNTVLRD
jgi:putative ABC transport system permease protein